MCSRLTEWWTQNMIAKASRLLPREIVRHRRCVLAAAQEVDFHEMDLTSQNLLLLAQVKVATVRARCLVGQTENFNGRYEPFAFKLGEDLQEWLAEFVVRHVDYDHAPNRGGNTALLGFLPLEYL